eukprot:CAMPEP_0170595158 /NCGR_PEP_ID=MMETSP0224-20130122/14402_1 /TAXON_ID=285029 /ORGANISM="Togula jolla, Strain CCCM 725" /LENGTH=270 /DNA_ID=CAMNT_0010919299 /DNA_START=14 /DNA_END=826 /DNA_ORIENTATION=-
MAGPVLPALAGAAGLAAGQRRHGDVAKCDSASTGPAQTGLHTKDYRSIPPACQLMGLHMCSAGKRIAVLGGSFDPITNGHLVSACEVVHSGKADEVWIVPCGTRPDKPTLKTPYRHRLMMCNLAVDTSFGSRFPIRVCDVEMLEPSALPTYDLLHRLMEEYPDKEFSFVIGSDLSGAIAEWDVGERKEWLLNECRWLVFDRPGFDMPTELEMTPNFTVVNPMQGCKLAHQELSSSEIRKRIKLNMGNMAMVEGLVPPPVLAHIVRYNLYV